MEAHRAAWFLDSAKNVTPDSATPLSLPIPPRARWIAWYATRGSLVLRSMRVQAVAGWKV
jgi:hypothetical protein